MWVTKSILCSKWVVELSERGERGHGLAEGCRGGGVCGAPSRVAAVVDGDGMEVRKDFAERPQPEDVIGGRARADGECGEDARRQNGLGSFFERPPFSGTTCHMVERTRRCS